MTHKKENISTIPTLKERNKTDRNGHIKKRIECLCNDKWKVENIEWEVEAIEWNVDLDFFPSCNCQKTEIKV